MALVQTFLIIFIGQTVFKVKIIGSIINVTGLVIRGALTFISLGYMLISFAKSTEGGQGIIQVTQFPMMFLSGIFFPVEIMPDYIKPVVKAIPLTYLGDALRQIMVGASPQHSMQTNIMVLVAWLFVTLILGIKFWKWE
jgi:ABC-2 type transport system permease protein